MPLLRLFYEGACRSHARATIAAMNAARSAWASVSDYRRAIESLQP